MLYQLHAAIIAQGSMFNATQLLWLSFCSAGEAVLDKPGAGGWQVPPGVTSVSVVW